MRATFKGRAAEATIRDVPMTTLAKGGAGAARSDAPSRGRWHAVLCDPPDLRTRCRDADRRRSRLQGRAPVRGADRRQSRRGRYDVPGGRSRPGHAGVRSAEGAPLRRGHRSGAGGIRAGRIVVRDDGVRRRAHRGEEDGARSRAGRTCGAAAPSITSSATTIACCCSRRGSPTATMSSPTSCARRPPARSRRHRRRVEEMYEPEVAGRTATQNLEIRR